MHFSGHCNATEEESDPRTPGKGMRARNVDSGLQVQPEKDGGSSARQSWMETDAALAATRHKSSHLRSRH